MLGLAVGLLRVVPRGDMLDAQHLTHFAEQSGEIAGSWSVAPRWIRTPHAGVRAGWFVKALRRATQSSGGNSTKARPVQSSAARCKNRSPTPLPVTHWLGGDAMADAFENGRACSDVYMQGRPAARTYSSAPAPSALARGVRRALRNWGHPDTVEWSKLYWRAFSSPLNG